MSDLFAAQFTPDGEGYRYRRQLRAAAIRVSKAERDAFVSRYARAMNQLRWLALGLQLAAISIISAVFLRSNYIDRSHIQAWLVGSVIIVVAMYLVTMKRLARIPTRALAGRPVVAPPLDRVEFRRVARRALPWWVFVIGLAGVAYMWLTAGPRNNLFVGSHLLWSVATVLYLVVMAYYARLKWQAGQD